MKPSTKVGIRDAKARLSELVKRARAGQTVILTERGRPVARIIPIRPPQDEDSYDAIVQRLIETGHIDGPPAPPETWEPLPRPVKGKLGLDAQKMLREDRDYR